MNIRRYIVQKNISLIALIILLLFTLTSCQKTNNANDEDKVVEPTYSADVKSHNDNIMSDTAKSLGIDHESYPKIDGSTSTLSIVRAINNTLYVGENDNCPQKASKTIPSYKLLIDKEVDMIFVPYASAEVLKLAKKAGVKLEFYPIAAEALVFITPAANEAENISMQQIRDIYLNYGITNWSKLGGPNYKLVPICRNPDSGSQSQMDNLILENRPMHAKIEKNHVELTMEGMLEQVAFYHTGGLSGRQTKSYALGYTLYTYLKNIGEITGIDRELKMLAFEGIVPNEDTIANGTYPLADAYYAVIRSELPKDHSARTIITWLKDDAGRAMLENLNYIIIDN